MSADLNRVTIIGRLTRDPEVTHARSGDPVSTLRLAVSSRVRAGDGTWADKANYFDVVVWGRQAEVVGEHLAKGRRIGVDGRLAWREWEASDGSRRQSVEVVASDVFFLDAPRERAGSEAASGDAEPIPAGAGSDDDIPF